MTIIPRANPFALSTCGRFVVERHPGEIYPNVMTVDEAIRRQKRAERLGAEHEAEADRAYGDGSLASSVGRQFASIHLTIAADIAIALNGADLQRAA